MNKILIYGYGNPGRQDDGLGPAFAEFFETSKEPLELPQLDTDSNYQLNIEDAEIISKYDLVIFADASVVEDVNDYKLLPMNAANADVKYTLHAASPGYILQLCQQLYGQHPETWIMHIKGYVWDFKEGLSPEATKNLSSATNYLAKWLKQKTGA